MPLSWRKWKGVILFLLKAVSHDENLGYLGNLAPPPPLHVLMTWMHFLSKFTCQMYVAATKTEDVNDLRYQLFCMKRGEVESSQLPPCRDCLIMHAQLANYQAAVWRRSLNPTAEIHNPIKHGWTEEDGKLAILWMRSPPAPDAVLQLLTCKCVCSCKLSSCTCLANRLPCTDMCRLQTCSNLMMSKMITLKLESQMMR